MKVLVKPTAVKKTGCSGYCPRYKVDCPTPTGNKNEFARSIKK